MSRVVVKNRHTGAVRSVAPSAVPMLAPGGWVPLDEAELAEYEQQRAEERAAREASLTPESARRAALEPVASLPAAAKSVAADEGGSEPPKRSGAKRRTDNDQERDV